jgi:hypothetical protein
MRVLAEGGAASTFVGAGGIFAWRPGAPTPQHVTNDQRRATKAKRKAQRAARKRARK